MFRDRLNTLEKEYIVRMGEEAQIKQDINNINQELVNDMTEIADLESIRILYNQASEEARLVFIEQLQDIVTKALQHIFGSDFEFIAESKELRGKPEVEFYVKSIQNNKEIITKPEDSRGGGVVDIISLALRQAVLELYNNPKLNGPLLLDEPGKHVSEDYSFKLADFLSRCTQIFNRQIIMITHQSNLAVMADKKFSVELKGGKSVVS